MVYEIKADGQDIYDPGAREMVLLEPKLEMEINTAGSLEFTMPPFHAFYNSMLLLTTDLEVYEDGQLIWFGRPVEIKTDFYRQKKFYCEGALAFFNDSVQEYHIYWEISVHQFFQNVIECHNSQVGENRQFRVGEITVPNKKVYRKVNYEQTIDVLNRQCLSAEGGYFFIRRENGVNYIDWLNEMPYICSQPIEFGLNLLNLGSSVGGSEIATCVVPLGEEDETTHRPVTVESVNGGSRIIESDAASEYGRITKAVTFPGVKHPETLLKDGREYLANLQFDRISIECSAAELHYINGNYEMFRVGQMVHCVSWPHLVEKDLPLVQMSLNLDSAEKQITLGSVQEQNLTEIVAEAADTSSSEDLSQLEDQVDDLQNTLDDYTDKFDEYSGKTDDLMDSMDKYQELVDNYDSYVEKSDQYGEDIAGLQEQVSGLSETVEGLSGGGGDGWNHWIGTQSEYNAIKVKDPKTVYLIKATT